MATEIDIHWMDRVRLATTTDEYRSAGTGCDEPHALTAARVALCARMGATHEAMYEVARQRRMESTGGSRLARVSAAAVMIALGTLTSLVGSRIGNQPVLLCGFGLALLGVLLCCALVETWLDPQFGDLTRYMRKDEALATAEQIAALSKAAQADSELGRLIAGWWKEDSAPIRQQDLELVRNFQKIKQES